MSRQTVSLSKETTRLLKLYVQQRGVNNSAAIAGMVSDALDDWVAKQQALGKDVLSQTPAPVGGSLDLYRINRLSQKFSAIAFNLAKQEQLTQSPSDMVTLFLKVLETIVPDTFAPKQTKLFRQILAKYVSQAGYFQNWYQNYALLYPIEQTTFDAELNINGYNRFPSLADRAVDAENEEVVRTLISNYGNNVTEMVSKENLDDIKKFINEHQDGLIIVNGETGSGKSTLMIELAQKTHLEFQPIEIRSATTAPLAKISNMFARNNAAAVTTLKDMIALSKAQPANLKADTPMLLIHTQASQDEKTGDYRCQIADIAVAYH